jgi:FKBP-type peptidyl-prolyl cis-trans isomerase
MGRRRKRSNSDNDESLEQSYNQSQSHPLLPSVMENDDSCSAGEKISSKKAKVSFEKTVVESSTKKAKESSESLTKTDMSEKEKQKIERLQNRKKQRKEQKKAKALAKQESTVKQSNIVNSTKAKKKKVSTDEKDNSNTAFKSMAKGVQYRDVEIGKGPSVQERKKIRVTYTLRAIHRYGKILDSSNDFKFRIGRGEVVKGWDIGIMGMRQGGKRYLIVPPNAGYGGRDVGAGRGGLLFFEVTVLDC